MLNQKTLDLDNEKEIQEQEAELNNADDIAFSPGANADDSADIERHISATVRNLYEVYSYRHAATILAKSFPEALKEIECALVNFRLTVQDIGMPGGNESRIPKKFSRLLRPRGWFEARIRGDLSVKMEEYAEEVLANGKIQRIKRCDHPPIVLKNFIDGHKIDYVKGRVAFDLEWNSKDQTFDRDLYAMRAFHECGLISLGVMVTRSEELNHAFKKVPQLTKDGKTILQNGKNAGQSKSVFSKYGASTTWMGKLLYRLNAGRHGSCPILVFGITPKLIEDWK